MEGSIFGYSRKFKSLLKTIDTGQFNLKNDDFYGFLIVFTRVLFENVVAMETRKGLCLPLRLQTPTCTYLGKVTKFQEKISYHFRDTY